MKLTLSPLCLLALSVACGSSDIKTFSDGSWLKCTEDADCASVDGTCSSDRVCVDEAGNRIADPGLAPDAASAGGDAALPSPGQSKGDGGAGQVVEPPPAPPAGDAGLPLGAPEDAAVSSGDASAASVADASAPSPGDAAPSVEDASALPEVDAAHSPADAGSTEAGAQSMPPGAACELPVEPGPCKAAVARYAFNSATGICESFTYGGCGGNANNFETPEQCQKSCPAPASVCGLPAENGPCKAAIRRFAFNPETGQCGEFTYGGCGGNGNNFQTEEECNNHCSTPAAQCALPAATGPCDGAFTRYFYSAGSGQCYEFSYGGCEGNANNFETPQACESACGPFRRDSCLPGDTAVPSAGSCLQDDAACYQIAGGGYCTGPRASSAVSP